MANEHYVVFGIEDGGERYRGMGRPGSAAKEDLEPGLAAVVVPVAALAKPSTDLDIVRDHLLAQVDAGALAITADPFADVHAVKLAEALGGIARPLLTAEAEATGRNVDDVAAAAIAREAERVARRDAVEIKRICAKQAVRQADTIGAMALAAQVDWPA